jgi:hypothetical protein
MRLRRFTLAVVLSCSTLAASARADVAADKAAAEALFDEAKTLLKNGDAAAACPKFAESQRLDPGVGTLLYLGSCYERIDRLASAWATFREAAALAHGAAQGEREKTAISKADAIEPLVPRLAVDVAAPVPGLRVSTDGKAMADAVWGSSIPLDPGAYTIQAEAPGYETVVIKVTIAKGDRKRITVPALHAVTPAATPVAVTPLVAAPPPAPTTPPSAEAGWHPMKIAGVSLAGVGLAGVIVGAVFGVRAFSLAASVTEACPSGPCSPAVKDDADASRTSGNVSTVAFVVGTLFVATGAVLFLTAPKRAPRSAYLAPLVGPSGGGLQLGGTF